MSTLPNPAEPRLAWRIYPIYSPRSLRAYPPIPSFGPLLAAHSEVRLGGGLIAYMIQMKALRETRKHREHDHRRTQQLLANSLLVKMIRLHSNFQVFHKHFEDSFENEGTADSSREPWQFVLPIANLPPSVQFSPEELSMLLALKNNNVFNAVLPMDTIHNSLIEAANAFSTQRTLLTERLPVERAQDTSVGGTLTSDQLNAIRPQMIIVNQLVQQVRDFAASGFAESRTVLLALHALFQDKLDITYDIQLVE